MSWTTSEFAQRRAETTGALRRRITKLHVTRSIKSKKQKNENQFVPARDWKKAQEAICAPSLSRDKYSKAETIEDDWLAQLDLHIDTNGTLRDGYVIRFSWKKEKKGRVDFLFHFCRDYKQVDILWFDYK